MNDRLAVVARQRVGARRADRRGRRGRPRLARHRHRRARRLSPARLHPDPRPSLPDAVPRIRRRHAAARVAAAARLAAGGRAHAATLRASARLAAAELLRSGTTSVLTMETVHDTDVVFETLAEIGLRATVGKCMMDSDGEVPRGCRSGRGVDRREPRAARSGGTARRTAGCARRSRRGSRSRARASCSKRWPRCRRGAVARAHARVGESRRGRGRAAHVRRADNLEYLADTGLATPGSARRTASGSPTPSRRCSPNATSRSCTAPGRT